MPPGLKGGDVGENSRERLKWKEERHSLEVELRRDFGMSRVASRALMLRIGEYLDKVMSETEGKRGGGQIRYYAVARGEPAGKPIKYCRTIPVKLTLYHEEDAEVLHGLGSPALRRSRLVRLCHEAQTQKAALSYEDLSLLMGVDITTVGRLSRALAAEGCRVVTRGVVEDIGPGVTHKSQVLELYYRGFLPGQIACRIGHSLGSVERYLRDFARVVHLREQDMRPEIIVRITGLSPKTVAGYLDLRMKYDEPVHRPTLEKLLCRFGVLEEDGR